MTEENRDQEPIESADEGASSTDEAQPGIDEIAASDGEEATSNADNAASDEVASNEVTASSADEAALNEEASRELEAMVAEVEATAVAASATGAEVDDTPLSAPQSQAERAAVIEALVFVSDEPLSVKDIAAVLKEDKEVVKEALNTLAEEFNARQSGLQLREVAGGWQFATRPEYHEHVRAFLKTRPSAKLSIASLETLAVIAYRQPITVPEILEIRGVQSPSAIKTLLDKKLIVAKGRKETVGRPMMYGTSKEFLLQFGLKDLSELPSVEDFHDLSGGGS